MSVNANIINQRLTQMGEYPFPRLNALLQGREPPDGIAPILLSIGEPKLQPPAALADLLNGADAGWGRYPMAAGDMVLKTAIHGWLSRRYGKAAELVDVEKGILPVSGTREALFTIAQAVITPPAEGQSGPLVLMPNPFYQVYFGAAVLSGGQPFLVDSPAASGFLPDYMALPDETFERASLVYLCSPANPQGAVATLDMWKNLIRRARLHDVVVAADECYSEIYYGNAAPPGVLEACAALDEEARAKGEAPQGMANVVVFNSLSKRSSLPGLRSGFVAGDPALIAAIIQVRNYAMAGVPLPVQQVSATLWADETHVAENRALYRQKMDLAAEILGRNFDFFRPEGGIFLWLNVRDGEAATKELWQKAGVKVLPGAYLTQPDAHGNNSGTPYIRVAMVQDIETTRHGLLRLRDTLLGGR